MTPTSLIIVADRGEIKAYRVKKTPNRGANLQLVQALDLTDAHGRYGDKLTDQAGRFPVSDGNGRHANSIAERTALELETERRICKQLAEHITDVVKREAATSWSFAAPPSIHSSITDLLPPSIRNRVVEHVKSDLVKIEPARLAAHFRSLKPVWFLRYNRACNYRSEYRIGVSRNRTNSRNSFSARPRDSTVSAITSAAAT